LPGKRRLFVLIGFDHARPFMTIARSSPHRARGTPWCVPRPTFRRRLLQEYALCGTDWTGGRCPNGLRQKGHC
jgi:hypothetical protein